MNTQDPHEYRRQRRDRRLHRNLDVAAEAQAWAARHGFTLRVLNDGHHWLFQKPGLVAEWWPSSAKLVLNRDYLHDQHAPHWPQVAMLLANSLPARAQPSHCCPFGLSTGELP